MTADDQPDERRLRRRRKHLKRELRAAALYSALMRIEADPERSEVFRDLRDAKMRRAEAWRRKIDTHTAAAGGRDAFGLLCSAAARALGTNAVIPILRWKESRDLREYSLEEGSVDVAKDSRYHDRALEGLVHGRGAARPVDDQSATGLSGRIRAAVLGVNDGLVSNFSLVMGVSGGTDNADLVLLAGIAGLVAGAFSMAAGEYVSMRSQRDIYEHELSKQMANIRDWPAEERAELELIYRAKGLTDDEARLIASRVMSDPETALDTMAREKLGLDPNELGAPWGAAFASFAAFVGGAIVPILPFLFGAGNRTIASAALSAAALLIVGGALAAASGNRPYLGSLRMLLVGSLAAAVTYGIGALVRAAVGELPFDLSAALAPKP